MQNKSQEAKVTPLHLFSVPLSGPDSDTDIGPFAHHEFKFLTVEAPFAFCDGTFLSLFPCASLGHGWRFLD